VVIACAVRTGASAGGGERVQVIQVTDGELLTGGPSGGLDPGAVADHVVLRGSLTNLEQAASWNNVSSAHFITSKRYSQSFGDETDGMVWNGTAWVPAATIFNVSIRPSLHDDKYVFFIGGVERAALTLH